jgi:hypothetical protein
VIKFVSDLRQADGFLRLLPPIKLPLISLDATIIGTPGWLEFVPIKVFHFVVLTQNHMVINGIRVVE